MKSYTKLFILSMVLFSFTCFAQDKNETEITVHVDSIAGYIDANIYGQFAEHLGSCIYGGIWVGEDSSIPNTRGIRNDVIEALIKLKVPVLRWPGGCFADEYHWMDGIGPRKDRPEMVNTNWGGVVEDNSFGTHEFLDLCEIIGAEPYIAGNVGSGTVEEFSKWVEYTTFDGKSPMANLRRENGRDKPWKVKYWGIGNESWGCGGRMHPDYYSDLARRYSTFVKNYGDNQVFKIASGPNVTDSVWTDVVMKQAGDVINGLALHYYTNNNSPASDFTESGWFDVIQKTLRMDEIINMHAAIMDKYDPEKRVALVVDEWGTWHRVEPGTNPAFLYQQNTMRDAIVAASNLNIFHKHCDRVKMTNIAQMINVLQAMILTDDEKMVLTPTYHVFEMFNKHQDAISLKIDVKSVNYVMEKASIPAVNASVSLNSQGKLLISLCNVDPNNSEIVKIKTNSFRNENIKARILTSEKMNALNSFQQPETVIPKEFKDFKLSKDNLIVNMPAKSVIVLEVEGKLDSKIGNPLKVENPQPKLNYTYYKGVLYSLAGLDDIEIVRKGFIEQIKIPEENSGGDFAVSFSGYINIEKDGFYTFYINADDGANFYIDGKLIVNNDGRHAPIEARGFTSLKKGYHKIESKFFQAGGGMVYDVSIEGPGLEKKLIPSSMLFHENK